MRRSAVSWSVLLLLGLAAGDTRGADDAQVDSGGAADAAEYREVPPQGSLETIPVVPGLGLRLSAPRDWTASAQLDSSFIDLGQIPGAKLVVSRGWVGPKPPATETRRAYAESMLLVCVQAPVTEWVPGMEQLVFDRMNQMARDELGRRASLDAFESGTLQRLSTHFRQSFKAHGELGDGHGKGQVRVLSEERPDRPHNHARNVGVHILTVPVGTQQMVACSLSCGETERPDQKSFGCDASIASFDPLGDLACEPSVSTLGKFIAGARRQPLSAVGILAGLAMALAGIVLATRPRRA